MTASLLAPEVSDISATSGPGTTNRRASLRGARRFVPVLPFAIFVTAFLAVPAFAVVVGAFRSDSGSLTLANVRTASSGVYRHGFVQSLELAAITSVAPAILGLLLARAVQNSPGTLLNRLVTTASGVFANFGGVPLAFLFSTTLGATGVATRWLSDIGLNIYDHGFNLYTVTGIEIVYLYFQIPLMVLVITPALQGLKPAWREASDNLGGSGWHYWRHIGGPALLPSMLGSVLLLFGSALSAYATAEALTSGSVALTPIQIGTFLNGNVISGQENVGKALGLGLIIIITVVMIGYTLLQRRASKWLR